jgi:hypothetical protein
VPEKVIVTGRVYQPFGFGPRSGAALALGGVLSYLKLKVAPPEFPAASVHGRAMLPVASGGPEYGNVLSQLTGDRPPLLKLVVNTKGEVIQPAELGPGLGENVALVGAVLSLLIVTEPVHVVVGQMVVSGYVTEQLNG